MHLHKCHRVERRSIDSTFRPYQIWVIFESEDSDKIILEFAEDADENMVFAVFGYLQTSSFNKS